MLCEFLLPERRAGGPRSSCTFCHCSLWTTSLCCCSRSDGGSCRVFLYSAIWDIEKDRDRDSAGGEQLKSGTGCRTARQEAPFSPVAAGHSWGDWSCGVCSAEESCWPGCSCRCWPGCSCRCRLHVGVWSEATEPDTQHTTHNKNWLKTMLQDFALPM